MNFKKRLKIRLFTAIAYIVLGVTAIAVCAIMKSDIGVISSLGLCFAVTGIARLKQYFFITKNEERLRAREVYETDERNVYLVNKAKSAAFNIGILIACIALIVLEILAMHDMAVVIGACVFSFVVIYWIAYFILQKRF